MYTRYLNPSLTSFTTLETDASTHPSIHRCTHTAALTIDTIVFSQGRASHEQKKRQFRERKKKQPSRLSMYSISLLLCPSSSVSLRPNPQPTHLPVVVEVADLHLSGRSTLSRRVLVQPKRPAQLRIKNPRGGKKLQMNLKNDRECMTSKSPENCGMSGPTETYVPPRRPETAKTTTLPVCGVRREVLPFLSRRTAAQPTCGSQPTSFRS